jgi:hypothetical protein
MAFTIKKLLDHGTANPIVARLSLQILQILDRCDLPKKTQDKISALYMESLQLKLLRCWEIKERFREQFNSAANSYKAPAPGSQAIQLPQIGRLTEECHNFLYEVKNYIRDVLYVFNGLYETDFNEASQFTKAKKATKANKATPSLVDFAIASFGPNDPKTKFLSEYGAFIEGMVTLRNAVEHPGPKGHSGDLVIHNFEIDLDGKLLEPTWHREKNGVRITDPSSIRADMDAAMHNLLLLGEDVVVSWAVDHLKMPDASRIAMVPAERRDPKCAIKWVVTASEKLEAQIAAYESKRN